MVSTCLLTFFIQVSMFALQKTFGLAFDLPSTPPRKKGFRTFQRSQRKPAPTVVTSTVITAGSARRLNGWFRRARTLAIKEPPPTPPSTPHPQHYPHHPTPHRATSTRLAGPYYAH